MGGEICKRKGEERGPWYQIKCVKEIIVSKEAKGEDASFERMLLKSWAKYPGWEAAGMENGQETRRKLKSMVMDR